MKNQHGVRRPIRRGAFLILGALFFLGCTGDKVSDRDIGEIHIALTLPDGSSITSVAWKVVSGTSTIVASGTLNTTGSRMPSFISSLPAANGDTLNMTATTSGGVMCVGNSSPFNVVAGQSTMVNVNILCDGTVADGGTFGSVVVTGTLVPGDRCPALASWFITPQDTTGTDPIDVAVTASDPDSGDTLTYAWTATAGSFMSPTSATTQYTCAATGAQTLQVAITDSHAPAPCTTHVMFPSVNCQ
jgi:hypothetical protein